MTQIEGRSESVTIWLHGDDLKPAEVSRRLGVRPSKCWIKGDIHVTKTGAEVIRKTGMWKIVPPDRTVPPAVQAYELLKLLDGHNNLFQMFPARRVGGNPDVQLDPAWSAPDPKTGTPAGVGKGWDYAPGSSVSDLINALSGKVGNWPPELAEAFLKSLPEDQRAALVNAAKGKGAN